MKCDRCDSEATVHEVRIKGGKRLETHLCEQCAREQGMAVQAPAPITQLLTKYITSDTTGETGAATPAAAAPTVNAACPSCGTTYAQFRNNGLLGCSTCYEAFESQLGPLLSRAHEGGSHHSGKKPRSGPAPLPAPAKSKSDVAQEPMQAHAQAAIPSPPRAPEPSPADRVAELRAELEQAIRLEQYEQAVIIRDELARLESKAKPAARARKSSRGKGEDKA